MSETGLAAAKKLHYRKAKKLVGSKHRAMRQNALAEIAKHKAQVKHQLKTKGSEAVHAVVMDEITSLTKQGAKKHFKRMNDAIEKGGETIDGLTFEKDSINEDLTTLKSFDAIARQTFKIDEQKPLTPQQYNISVLLHGGIPEDAAIDDFKGATIDAESEVV